ncbi:MAG TPA: type IV-A pilus assembly ATPase PilB [Proteobacteria bacterium]|nr:type II secretion system protein E [bacterium BMS3Abin14]HDL53398.1 type IV-A pilus assembly ATPase PilB [Pseudomonadota bacterium]
MSAARLGEMLVRAKLIDEEQLKQALEEQSKSGGRLGYNLAKLDILSEADVVGFLSKQYGVPSINLAEFEIESSILKLIPGKTAKKYQLIPISRTGGTLTLAMADPTNVFALDDIKFMTGYNVEPVVASETAIEDAIMKYYESGGFGTGKAQIDSTDFNLDEDMDYSGFEGEMEAGPLLDVEEFDSLVKGAVDEVEVIEDDPIDALMGEVDAPIVKLVNGFLIRAYKMKVSDVHVEPYEKVMRIRYRLDGVCKTMMNLPLKIRNAVISRIKIMSKLDIAERRLPQDGRIKMKLGRRAEVDFRVSVLPTLFGEKIVLRLLDKANLQLDMTKLGFEEGSLANFKKVIHKPFGMVLVTGPTGSGKTTTLYSALAELNTDDVNIMTAEDPVEFNLMGINQVQMHDEIGLNFAAALRSFLRQDPDIILVGEIRDYETAEIGIKAALTGHMVLSTLHTNDAPSTINRLLNMGVEPFLVASAVIMVVAQRLARRVCESCKQVVEVPDKALIDIGFSPEESRGITCYKGDGCTTCGGTGYKGRVALYEVMTVDDEIKDVILRGGTTFEIKDAAIRSGMLTLRKSGLTKIKEGVTTIEEVLRVTFGD